MKYRMDKKWFFYSSKHMKPQVCWRHLLLSKKSTSHTHPHKVTKKEKWIFYSSKHMKPKFCWRPLLLSKKSTSYTRPHTVTKKEKWIFYSSKHISSHQMATNVRKIRDLGSNFSHETEVLLASFSTIKKSTSHTHPHTITKKEKWIFHRSKSISSQPNGY